VNTAAWQGPPSDILGYPAPIQQFVVRTNHVVVALQQVIAFREGCSFHLHVAVRRDSMDEAAWKDLCESHAMGWGLHPKPTDADLKLGVRFPDGSKATTVDNAFRGWRHPAHRPEAPALNEVTNTANSSDQFYRSDRQFWLWPLPQPGPFEFVIEWRKMGVDITSTTVDGSAIVEAAERALRYWP
jgi:hypothetical protein